jgi:PAS domain S-box-containing protein
VDVNLSKLNDMDFIRQEALEFAGIGLLRVSEDGVVVSVDDTALSVMDITQVGSEESTGIGRKLNELTACPISVDSLVSDLRRSSRIRREEIVFHSEDGAERWVQYDCYLVRDPISGSDYLQFVLQDVTERRRALQQDRIRQIAIDSSYSPIAMVDLNGIITYANTALATLWGYDNVDEVRGKRADSFWVDESLVEHLGVRLRRHSFWSGQLTAKRKDASTFKVHLSATRVLDSDGTPLCTMVSCVDISEQKRIEEELRNRVETERLVVRISSELVSRMSLDWHASITDALGQLGQFVKASAAAVVLEDARGERIEHVFEWWRNDSAHEFGALTGMAIDKFKWITDQLSEDRSVVIDGLPDVVKAAMALPDVGPAPAIESILLLPVQHSRETIGVFALCADDRGRQWGEQTENAMRIVGEIIANVVRRREAEDEVLRRVEFERIVTAVSSQFIGMAPEEIDEAINEALPTVGEFLKVDRCYLNWISDETGEVKESFEWCADGIDSFRSVLLDSVLTDEFPWAAKLFSQGQPLVLHSLDDLPDVAGREHRLMESHGIQSLVNVPITANRRLIGLFGLESVLHTTAWSDDSVVMATIVGQVFGNAMLRKESDKERRHLEAQVQHAQKLESLGVLAGGIAHDFNNILMGIIGNAGLAMMELPADSTIRECIVHIEKASQHAAELTTQLLAYSGKGAFRFRPVNLTRVVEEMMHLIEAAISKRAFLSVRLDPDLPEIDGDAGQLRQVILNLVTNASDAVEANGGNIRITTGVMKADTAYLGTTYLQEDLREGTYVFLEVVDTGCGMDRHVQSRIFDPFYSTKFPGRGLGLAAVLGIARAHRATIRVESALGEGTTFRVLFPCRQPADMPPQPPQPIEYEVDGSVVLVVDDEPVVRRIVRLTLERFGYKVLLAEDGRQALDVLRAHADEVNCILLDMTMPVMDGIAAYAEIRKIDARVPVIFSSGYAEIDASEKLVDFESVPFIQKPYTTVALIEAVSRAVRSRADPA